MKSIPAYRAHLAITLVVMLAAIYLASGTMAPYGATAQYPKVLEPCHYIVNIDHNQYESIFKMIRGDSSGSWHGSEVLRRLLYPLIALPLAVLMGTLAGGLLATMAIHAAAVLVFAGFVRRRVGLSAAVAVLWLLSTYPGITYWAGLPYAYVLIVPGSLFAAMILYRLAEAGNVSAVIRFSLLLGVIFVGYDPLGPFFGAAAVLVLIAQRRWKWILPAVVAIALPTSLVLAMLTFIEVGVVNPNTAGYGWVVAAYLHPGPASEWMRLLLPLPRTFVAILLFGNMVFLPLLFVTALVASRWRGLKPFRLPDQALLLAALAIFLFMNAAPPYYGWQHRGEWIARMYQPVFPAFLMAIARLTEELSSTKWGRRWAGTVALTVLANASIAFGPLFLNPLSAWVYHRFYIHSPPRAFLENLQRFGRRPLGVCSDSHRWDDLPNPHTGSNRPSYMYRYPPAKR